MQLPEQDDLGPEYENILAALDAPLSQHAVTTYPRNSAILALLRFLERGVADQMRKDRAMTTVLLLAGITPYSLPDNSSKVRTLLSGCTAVMAAVDRSKSDPAVPLSESDACLEAAGDALLQAAAQESVRSALDQAAAGWRSLEVEQRLVKLMHRSPDRMARMVEHSLRAEAEHNAEFVESGKVSKEDTELFRDIEKLRRERPRDAGLPDDDMLTRAASHARRAGQLLHRWDLPADETVAHQGLPLFTVGDYRLVNEVIHGIALILEAQTDDATHTRLLSGTSTGWVERLAGITKVSRDAVSAIVRFLTYRSQAGKGTLLPISSTPFFDIGGDILVLSVTCVVWRDPQWALRALWKSRLPRDYNAKLSDIGDALSDDISTVFAGRKWTYVTRREVLDVTDIDSGAGIPGDPFFLTCEAKAFMDDPVRQADDLKNWRQLSRGIKALEEPGIFARVLGPDGLAPGEIRGLLVVPGRATAGRGVSDQMTLVGLDDLREMAGMSASPRDLWKLIQSREVAATLPTKTYTQETAGWTFEVDGVDVSAIPRWIADARPAVDGVTSAR